MTVSTMSMSDLLLGLDSGRAWAGGRPLSIAERVAVEYQPMTGTTFLAVLPAAMDANELLNQASYVARHGRDTALLQTVELGPMRIFASASVVEEVERHLTERAIAGKLSVEALGRAWRERVHPKLRVVDTAGLEDLALEPISSRDLDDRPTAVLSLFVGAKLTWSGDDDLLDLGYAERYTARIAVAARTLGAVDLSAFVTITLSVDGIRAAHRALRGIIANPQRRPIAVAALVLAGVALAVVIVKCPRVARAVAAEVAGQSLQSLVYVTRVRVDAANELPARLVLAPSENFARTLGQLLALAPGPMTEEEIAIALTRAGLPSTEDTIALTLRSLPMFVRGSSGWQLGEW